MGHANRLRVRHRQVPFFSPGATIVTCTTPSGPSCTFTVTVLQRPTPYDFHDLGSFDSGFVNANDINDGGQVVGHGLHGVELRGAFWPGPNANTPTEVLGAFDPSTDQVFLYANSDSGLIVGVSSGLAAVWIPSSFNSSSFSAQLLPNLGRPNSFARGINAAGKIVGAARLIFNGHEEDHAALWIKEASGDYAITDLGILALPNASGAQAIAINSTDQIVGVSTGFRSITREFGSVNAQFPHACFWAAGATSPVDLTPDLDEHSQALSINNAGKIVGHKGALFTAPGVIYPHRAVVWIPDVNSPSGFRVVVLPSLDPTKNDDTAVGITDGDQDHPELIVGNSAGRGVVWTACSTQPDTYSIQELPGPGVGRQVGAINNKGEIVGTWSPTSSSSSRGAYWGPDPIPPLVSCPGAITISAVTNCQAAVSERADQRRRFGQLHTSRKPDQSSDPFGWYAGRDRHIYDLGDCARWGRQQQQLLYNSHRGRHDTARDQLSYQHHRFGRYKFSSCCAKYRDQRDGL
jgi:uncharacterized membrane protein